MKKLMIFVAACLAGGSAHAATSYFDHLVPVVFTHFESNIADEKSSVIAESFSRQLQAAFIDVYATETLGSSSKLSPPLELAILGSAGYALGEIDRAIETKVMPEIRPTLALLAPGESMGFSVEVLWADRALADKIPHDSFISDSMIAALKFSHHADVADFLSMRWIDADSEDADGQLRRKLRSNDYLRRLRAATINQWMPWDSTLEFTITKTGIGLNVSALMLPARIQDVKQRKQAGLTVERVIYSPDMHPDYVMDLANLTFNRLYATNEHSDDGALRVSFGQWIQDHFLRCSADACLKSANHVPTIHGVVQFSESSWWDSMVGWFRSWVVREVEVSILLKDLQFSYDRETHKLSVLPERSQIPIIVRNTSLFGNETAYLLDKRAEFFGVNFYESFVGTQITDGLSVDLNRSLTAADKSLSEFVAQIAGSYVR